jgi:hypothetical protein
MICTLHVHGLDFSRHDVVINPTKFDTARAGALLSIQPVAPGSEGGRGVVAGGGGGGGGGGSSSSSSAENRGIVLQLQTLDDVVRGQAHISILSSIAQKTGLTARQRVRVSFVATKDVALDFVDMSVCSDSASRSELWMFRQTLQHKCICLCAGRRFCTLGVEAQATALLKDGVPVCVRAFVRVDEVQRMLAPIVARCCAHGDWMVVEVWTWTCGVMKGWIGGRLLTDRAAV